MTVYIEDDTPDIVSPRTIEFCQTHYWVCAFKDRGPSHETPKVFWWDWLFNITEPPPVPNPQMHWRRPTYPEIAERERVWREDPERFLRETKRHAEHFKAYHRPPQPRRGPSLLIPSYLSYSA